MQTLDSDLISKIQQYINVNLEGFTERKLIVRQFCDARSNLPGVFKAFFSQSAQKYGLMLDLSKCGLLQIIYLFLYKNNIFLKKKDNTIADLLKENICPTDVIITCVFLVIFQSQHYIDYRSICLRPTDRSLLSSRLLKQQQKIQIWNNCVILRSQTTLW